MALEPLVRFAEASSTAVIGLIHVNKSTSSDALSMLMGSRAFAAVARAVLFVMSDPDDEGVRLLGQAKNNLGRTDLPTMSFRIAGECVAVDTPQGAVWTGKLDWLGEGSQTLREAIEASQSRTVDRSATDEAGAWLEDYLVAAGGPVDSATCKKDGAKNGHPERTLKRSCQRLGVKVASVGFPRRTTWTLPSSAGTSALESVPTGPTVPTGRLLLIMCVFCQLGQLGQSGHPPRLASRLARRSRSTHPGPFSKPPRGPHDRRPERTILGLIVETRLCVDCAREFEITQGEKEFMESKDFALPRRCHTCRAARRARQAERDGVAVVSGRTVVGGG